MVRTFAVLLLGAGAAFAQTDIQGEDAFLFSAFVRQDRAGYTGTGYVSVVPKTGAYMEFVSRRTTAATDTVAVVCANGDSSRNFAVTLNGTTVGTSSFPSTGSWTTWGSRVIAVPLQAGQNRLRLTTTTNTTTYPVVDRIRVAGQAAVVQFKLTLTESGDGVVAAAS